jgi:hypothetical protein
MGNKNRNFQNNSFGNAQVLERSEEAQENDMQSTASTEASTETITEPMVEIPETLPSEAPVEVEAPTETPVEAPVQQPVVTEQAQVQDSTPVDSVLDSEGKLLIDLGRGEYISVHAGEYNGRRNFGIREMYTDPNNELRFTKKGVTVNMERAKLIHKALGEIIVREESKAVKAAK